ncbi:MAG: hypothetical protein RJA77_350, partial [Pseudomonadota bacterium]
MFKLAKSFVIVASLLAIGAVQGAPVSKYSG